MQPFMYYVFLYNVKINIFLPPFLELANSHTSYVFHCFHYRLKVQMLMIVTLGILKTHIPNFYLKIDIIWKQVRDIFILN